VAIVKGLHADHGTAVDLTEEKRSYLLFNTTYGLTDDEALWGTLASWDSFQPRRSKPRTTSGRPYYPAEYSHVFEKHWDDLPDLGQSPDFASQSPYCQEQMSRFSSSLSTMDLSEFQPLVTADAKRPEIETAEKAAISRLRPIHDGPDFWGNHRSSDGTGSGAPAPG
jgi:hypothetical protein